MFGGMRGCRVFVFGCSCLGFGFGVVQVGRVQGILREPKGTLGSTREN